MQRIAATAVLFAVTIAPSMGEAQLLPPGHPPPGGSPNRPPTQGALTPSAVDPFSPETLRKELGFTQEQVRKFSQLRADYNKKQIQLDAAIRIGEIELGQLLQQPEVDVATVEHKVREIEQLRSEQFLSRIRSMFDAKTFLTNDQFTRLREVFLAMGRQRGEMEEAIKETTPALGPSVSPQPRMEPRRNGGIGPG